MPDFWKQFDAPYRFFSQFCDSDDWHAILHALAGAIADFARDARTQPAILDVGCGNGIATQTMCEMLFAKIGFFPLVTVVEPSGIARERMEANLLDSSQRGVRRGVFEYLHEVPSDEKFDVALLIHSTYYIEQLAALIDRLVKQHLRTPGILVTLVLPQTSPFFLGLDPLANCAETVLDVFKGAGLKCQPWQLESRFRLPGIRAFTDDELSALKSFMRPNEIDFEGFKVRINQTMGHGRVTDFQDFLIVGRK